MLRVMKEKNQTADQVMKTWQKRFLPPDLLKRSIAPSNVAQRLKNSLLNKLATKHLKEILEERALQHDTKSVFYVALSIFHRFFFSVNFLQLYLVLIGYSFASW